MWSGRTTADTCKRECVCSFALYQLSNQTTYRERVVRWDLYSEIHVKSTENESKTRFPATPTWNKIARKHSMTLKRHNLLIIPNWNWFPFWYEIVLRSFVTQFFNNLIIFSFFFLYRCRYVKHNFIVDTHTTASNSIRCIFKFRINNRRLTRSLAYIKNKHKNILRKVFA